MFWMYVYKSVCNLPTIRGVNEKGSNCCLTLDQPFFSYIMARREQVNFHCDDDEVRFVLDQHAELDFYSACTLKQQSADRHVAPIGARTHDQPHSRRARKPLHHRCRYFIRGKFYQRNITII